jgi:hypothetical protein
MVACRISFVMAGRSHLPFSHDGQLVHPAATTLARPAMSKQMLMIAKRMV